MKDTRKYLVGWKLSESVFDKDAVVHPMTLKEAFKEATEACNRVRNKIYYPAIYKLVRVVRIRQRKSK